MVSIGAFVLSAQFPGQSQHAALDRAVRSATAVERAGLDEVWLAEHHFVPYGVCPSATTLAALVLGRTRRVRVGTAVSVLPTAHPVALGEQAALLHLTSDGRFSLGVGRGGPWVDLAVFGAGLSAYESGFPDSLELLLRWLREPRVGAEGPRYSFPEVPVVPRSPEPTDHPEVLVACTSPGTVALAAQRGLPMILGMHCGDAEKSEMLAHYRRQATLAGRDPAEVERVGHVTVGVAQVADTVREARAVLGSTLPGWLRDGLSAHRTVDGERRRMRDPEEYTALLCDLHPVGSPKLCADRMAATTEATGITRFAFLLEGSGDAERTEENIARMGAEVAALLR